MWLEIRLNWNLCTNFSVYRSMEYFHSNPTGHIFITFLFLVRSRNGRDFLSHFGRYQCRLGLIPHKKALFEFSVVKLDARSSLYLGMKHQPKANPGPQVCSVHLHYHLLWLFNLQTCAIIISQCCIHRFDVPKRRGEQGLWAKDLWGLWFTKTVWRIKMITFCV